MITNNRPNSVLKNKPTRFNGYQLTEEQQLWGYYIIPGICFLIIYLLDFSLNLSVALDLLNKEKNLYGCLTILFIYLPAFGCTYVRLSNPTSTVNNKEILLLLWKEIRIFILLPFSTLKCLGVQLFWITELINKRSEQEEVLMRIENSFNKEAETYLFLQIFLQHIPQAIFQFYLITVGISNYNETVFIQAFCSLISLAMAALGVMRYHRYESQRIGGRKPIWYDTPPPSPDPSPLPSPLPSPKLEEIPPEDPLMPHKPNEPKRLLRSQLRKALEEDNPVGKLLLFLFWFLFMLSRIVTVVTALKFFPIIAINILIVHMIIMFFYYLWYPINISRKIFLAIISTLCIVEVSIQIKKIAYLYILIIISTLAEDTGLALKWYVWGNWRMDLKNSSWYNYVMYFNINSRFLSYVFLTLYMAYFKPQVKYIPREKMRTQSVRITL